MRPVTYAIVKVEDRLATMGDYLDEVGMLNEKGEAPRDGGLCRAPSKQSPEPINRLLDEQAHKTAVI